MPLPYYEDDLREEVIRTEYKNLESTTWWQSLQIDAVVLYSWGAPRYRNIAKAIHQAGIRLVVHMDSSGDFVGVFPEGTSCLRKLLTWGRVKLQDILRSRHLSYADVITMCPDAAKAISQKLFYSQDIVDKCYPMPCPVNPHFVYDSCEKKAIILCIGRWDDNFQKRPAMLMQTLEHLYTRGTRAETRIYGTITAALRCWHEQLPANIQRQIKLLGAIENAELANQYSTAQIALCTSSFESSHIVSAEALCCGCSVVTPNRPIPLRDVLWYTSKNSGTVSAEDTPESLAEAIQHELHLWESGQRDPHAIARAWQPHFHTDKVFNNIFS